MDYRWRDLARGLGGSFAARARGIVSPELTLLSNRGETFGRIRDDETGETRIQAGDLSATLTPSPGGGYKMTTAGGETLTVEPSGSATALRLTVDDRVYEASISPLRNSALARPSDGGASARVSGGLAGRRYEATFDPEDPAALPTAIFLLKHLTNLRSRAYRT